jgi:tetratricopeptide (TPR) repeat protein
MLSELNRGPEAEELLTQSLGRAIQANKKETVRQMGDRTLQPILFNLVKVYHASGRFEDVIRLLDDAPYWGAKDLLDVADTGGGSWQYYSGHHIQEPPLAYYAANALVKLGKPEQARAILSYLLQQRPGLDRLYELLLIINPTNTVAELDALFAKDQFEERPLIWKAHWLRMHEKLEEAEKTARQAVSIDPSDGEEGPGDRMRAYAELAEIREARGDKKEADFFRGAVAAIRESETADRLHEAGLLKRAVNMYQDSLTHFADAYCIQSRLAIQLADLGKHEEAEEHYRRAYELMPESFGRVESHCFGCERAFEGERAQSIAEKVFKQFAEKSPNKPQVHYLLGYLREEQDRPKEAIGHFRTAVKLDPDYLNAWAKISGLGDKVFIPPTERDTVAFNLIRLDPLQRHAARNFETVTDLKSLWNEVEAARLKEPARPKSLYVLQASKAGNEKSKSAAPGASPEFEDLIMYGRNRIKDGTPAAAVARNGFIRAAMQLMARSENMMLE